MPPDDKHRVEIAFTSEFQRNLRRLAKKYPNIRSDLTPVIEQLEQGQSPGDQVRQTHYTVYKVRLRNTDSQRGKSGGYRILYYVKAREQVILVTIYSKSDQGDVSAATIRKIISQYEQ